jgi:hypothetical protein
MTATTTTAKKRTSRAKASAAPKEELNIELPANPFMFEILNLFNSPLLIGREEKKVEILKKYEDLSLKAIFIWNFDDSLITALPSGDIPYADTLKQTSFSGTVTDKIDLATSFMGELNSNSLGTSSEV